MAALPSVEDLRSYMQVSGWEEGATGVAGSLWSKNGTHIGVPGSDDSDSIRGAVERLAWAEQRSPTEVFLTIQFLRFDVTNFCAENDNLATKSIPLSAARTMLRAARMMLRAAGTTAIRERGEIRGSYSPLGNEVAKTAQMGHTEEGSFIIPVLVPVHEVPPEDVTPEPLVTIERSAPEPLERRVTRTLAQSLKAISEVIVEPAREPTVKSLYAAVERGVSRELCISVSKVLKEPAVERFETRFRWAPVVEAPASAPSSVMLESSARELIDIAADRLHEERIEPSQVFSGKIVELRHVTDEPVGYVTISTVRRGRLCEIRMELPLARYEEALIWHRDNWAILVEGEVKTGRDRKLEIHNIRRLHPINEMYIPGMFDSG